MEIHTLDKLRLLKVEPKIDKRVFGFFIDFFMGKNIDRPFFEYLINDIPLSILIDRRDYAGALGSFGKLPDKHFALGLLKEKIPETETGRVPLYICPACGDLGCNLISVEISTDQNNFIWSNIGLETDYEYDPEDPEDELIETSPIDPFYFSKEEYRKVFCEFIDAV